MPFIKVPMSEAKEQDVVPEGEYDLRIVEVDAEKESKSGKPMIGVIIAIESSDHPNASPIFEYLNLPHEDDSAKASAFKLLQIARFCHAFEIPFEDNGFDTDDIMGATGNMLVVQDTY